MAEYSTWRPTASPEGHKFLAGPFPAPCRCLTYCRASQLAPHTYVQLTNRALDPYLFKGEPLHTWLMQRLLNSDILVSLLIPLSGWDSVIQTRTSCTTSCITAWRNPHGTPFAGDSFFWKSSWRQDTPQRLILHWMSPWENESAFYWQGGRIAQVNLSTGLACTFSTQQWLKD